MILADLRYALRSLARVPVLALAAIGSLTLGIATAAVVFSLVNAAMLRPPPFEAADRLAVLNITQRTPGEGLYRQRWSWSRFQRLAESVTNFEAVGSSSNAVLTLAGDGPPEPVPIEFVSSGYLTVLRAPITLGRAFGTEADRPGADATVILGHDLWRRRFGADSGVLGRAVQLNGVSLTVIGVAGPEFAGVSGLARAWAPASVAPLTWYPGYLTNNENFITAIGRLAPGVTLAQAEAELAVLGPRIHAELPSEADTPDDRFSATAMALNDARVDVVTRRALALLAGAVAVLFLIACANVASLLLGRAEARRREIAIRLAVGAGRRGLIRLLLVEGAVIAGVSGLLGSLLTAWVLVAVRIPPTLARGRNFYGAVGEFAVPSMDWRVLLFVVAASAASVLLFGLVPALQSTRADVATALRGGSRAAGRAVSLREMAVGVQVALSVVLLVGCGLLLTSYRRLRAQPLGIDPTNLLTFMIRPSDAAYPPAAAPALLDRVLAEIARVPGVTAATVDGCTPLTMQCARASLRIVGRGEMAADPPLVQRHYVAPGHFATLGIPLLRGREITAADRSGAPLVVVINQAAADRFWPGQDPIGQRVWFEDAPVFGSADSSALVVGVAGNVAYQPLDDQPVQPDFFTPYPQFTYASRMVMARTAGDPASFAAPIARAVERADPGLALFDVQTMEERAQLSWSKQTAQTAFFFAVAGIALVLAVGGVYAVTAYYLVSRMREIGVRIALGAPARRVIGASVGRTVRIGIAGGAVGLVTAAWLSRIAQANLHETSPLAPGAYLGAGGVLALALVAASWLPARRALRVDPVEVLRPD
ncbi:MAG: ABC transporter permease [Gemmatimonadales bacterium]